MSQTRNTKYSCHFWEQQFDDEAPEASAMTVLSLNFQESHEMILAMKTKNPILVLMIRSLMSNCPYRDGSGSDM